MGFEKKTVIVTGAGSGIGAATALEYGKRGAKVLVADINADTAARTAEAIRASGGTAEAHQVDLRKKNEITAMVGAAVQHFGGLDILANVGAIYPSCRFDAMSEEFWDNLFGVDLKGPLFAMQAALPHLKTSAGNIVNVASGAAFYPIAGLAAYAAAKAALVALGRVVALESAPEVRVNTVVPGPTASAGTGSSRDPSVQADAVTRKEAASIQRWLEPAEIADVIVWVSSDAAAAVNGALLRVADTHHML
jgi:NAD(P)-dependent dehydrogenase (short-subunit alcohol dehydrogenase family)